MSGRLLPLLNLTPAGSRSKHLSDGVGSNRGKAICGGTGREFSDAGLYTGQSTIIGIVFDASAGVLVEHLHDEAEVFFALTVAAMVSRRSGKRGAWR